MNRLSAERVGWVRWRLGSPAEPAAVVLAAFVFYLATLAPGLLWGDPAKFQRMAWQLDLRFDATGHPLWVALAHPLTRIPGLDPALGANLSSAILSALALWPAIRIMRRLGASARAAALACGALVVSHTWWLHAVTAEVYALNSLLSLLVLDATLALTARDPGRPPSGLSWFLIGSLFGIATGNHLLVVTWLPGLVWLWSGAASSGPPRGRAALATLCGALFGLAPFLALRATIMERGESLAGMASRLTRQALSSGSLVNDLLLWAGYLLYQFPLPLILAAAAAGGARLWRERRAQAIGLLLLYAGTAAFATTYQVRDRFAFYLPSYLVVAILAACGLDALLTRWAPLRTHTASAWLVTALVCVAGPPLVYRTVARLSPGAIVRLVGHGLSIRDLPEREDAWYHLYPGKAGDEGARRFGERAFAVLPQRAVVLADFTIQEPLRYLQLVEGLRPDLEIFYVSPRSQLETALRERAREREVFLAAADAYYDNAGLSTRFDIVPAGPLFHLVPR